MKTLPAIALLVVTLSGCAGGGGGGSEPTTPSPRGRAPDPAKLAQDLHGSFGGTFKCVVKGPADSKHWLYECRHDHNPSGLVVIAASDGSVVNIHSEPN